MPTSETFGNRRAKAAEKPSGVAPRAKNARRSPRVRHSSRVASRVESCISCMYRWERICVQWQSRDDRQRFDQRWKRCWRCSAAAQRQVRSLTDIQSLCSRSDPDPPFHAPVGDLMGCFVSTEWIILSLHHLEDLGNEVYGKTKDVLTMFEILTEIGESRASHCLRSFCSDAQSLPLFSACNNSLYKLFICIIKLIIMYLLLISGEICF